MTALGALCSPGPPSGADSWGNELCAGSQEQGKILGELQHGLSRALSCSWISSGGTWISSGGTWATTGPR